MTKIGKRNHHKQNFFLIIKRYIQDTGTIMSSILQIKNHTVFLFYFIVLHKKCTRKVRRVKFYQINSVLNHYVLNVDSLSIKSLMVETLQSLFEIILVLSVVEMKFFSFHSIF
jgi:hypothetical protein